MDIEQLRRYAKGILELEKTTFLYCPPREMLAYGDKSRLNANLDAIATIVTKTARPPTFEIDPKRTLPLDGVLKRSYSSVAANVVFPTNTTENVVNQGMDTKRKFPLRGSEAVYNDCWIWQAYNPLIRKWCGGEARLFMLGGKMVSGIWASAPTKLGDLDIQRLLSVLPMDLMS